MRIAVAIIGIAVATPCGIAGWLYLYTGGLPDVRQLRAFVPDQQQTAYLMGESRPITVLPASVIGPNLRNAVVAAQGDPDPRGWIHRYYEGFTDHQPKPRYGNYSYQISRMLPHDSYRSLKWHLWSLRTSIQIERRFTPDEMLTIYINGVYFGDDDGGNHIHGIHDASLQYLQKAPADLTTAEAALLAAMISRPAYLSPTKHPDRAIAARNRVIDRMLTKGFLTEHQAASAKEAPL